MEYCVDVIKTNYGSVRVEAESRKEAIDLAKELYENALIEMDDSDLRFEAYVDGEY